jgi:hypothetical protein
MPFVHRYRRRRGPQHTAGYHIRQRDGRLLLDMTLWPWQWSDRRGMVFWSKAAAEQVISEKFSGQAARELLGLEVVKA